MRLSDFSLLPALHALPWTPKTTQPLISVADLGIFFFGGGGGGGGGGGAQPGPPSGVCGEAPEAVTVLMVQWLRNR